MRRYLLDTNMAGDYMNGRNGVHERCRDLSRRGSTIGICIPVLGELYYGVEKSSTRDRNLQELRRTLPSWRIWPYTQTAAERFGAILAHLVRVGRPMQKIDIMIGAIALDLGNCIVASSDSDLLAIPGLTVENWTLS